MLVMTVTTRRATKLAKQVGILRRIYGVHAISMPLLRGLVNG